VGRVSGCNGWGTETSHVYCGDGSLGLAAFAPYDGIVVAAGGTPRAGTSGAATDGRRADDRARGREEHQVLLLLTKHGGKFSSERKEPCRFVPLLGRHGWRTCGFDERFRPRVVDYHTVV